jgi:hypothetical protein
MYAVTYALVAEKAMTSERWQQVECVYDDAFRREEPERAAFLAQAPKPRAPEPLWELRKNAKVRVEDTWEVTPCGLRDGRTKH